MESKEPRFQMGFSKCCCPQENVNLPFNSRSKVCFYFHYLMACCVMDHFFGFSQLIMKHYLEVVVWSWLSSVHLPLQRQILPFPLSMDYGVFCWIWNLMFRTFFSFIVLHFPFNIRQVALSTWFFLLRLKVQIPIPQFVVLKQNKNIEEDK